MLNHLLRYSERLQAEPGFKPKSVRWSAVLDPSGRLVGVVPIGDVQAKKNQGRSFPNCPDLSQAELVAGSGGRCHFLVETAEVVALLYSKKTADDPKAMKRVASKHAFFTDLVRQAAARVPSLAAIAACMGNPKDVEQLRERLTSHAAAASDKVCFQVGLEGAVVVDRDDWHDWWRVYRRTLRPSEDAAGPRVRCLLTGESVQPVPTHPKIEGLADVGGSGMGTVLIGFDKPAFASYGLEQSHNAPMSEETANAYRSALNDLIRNHSKRLVGARVAYWFKNTVPPADDPVALLLAESPEQEERSADRAAWDLLGAIRSGTRPDLAGNQYYALTLSGAGGRVMVRDWMEGAFPDLMEKVNLWFEDLAIVHRDGQGLAPPPKFLAVLAATVREIKEISPPMVASAWRAALRAGPIPISMMTQVVRRTTLDALAGEAPNHAAFGLLKAHHVRKQRRDGGGQMADMKPYLNEEHPEPAYHCGRLMAAYAALQRAALGDVGAGVMQRYYGAASTTPALVLGRLARTSQHHLGKLDPGLAYWFEQQLSEIWSRLGAGAPGALTLEQQSLFALGYYQQLADMRTKKSDKTTHEEAHDV